MKLPIEVKDIQWEGFERPEIRPDRLFGTQVGAFVAVRLASKEDTKTYLGIMLGDYMRPQVTFDSETGTLTFKPTEFMGNPAMWVPDLNRIVMGFESWWGEIKSVEDLKQITDADIQNVWYVKALKALAEKEKAPE